MKNKKGFISISVIYSFFVIFLLFLVLIMSSYINNRFKYNVYKNDIKKKLIANSVEDTRNTLSNIIFSKASLTNYISSQDSTIYRIVNQNGVRYEGKDPDNYVVFNGEKWRIIGAFEGSTLGLTSGEYYTKIIRESSIEARAWNNRSINNWANSSLNSYLNNNYISSINSTYRSMIVEAMWYTGYSTNIFSSSSQFYRSERNGTTTMEYIGLMYASDYGYAAFSSNCSNINVYLSSYSDRCAAVDWLYSRSDEHILTTYSSPLILIILSSGQLSAATATRSYHVRPTLYLDSNVKVISGSGSQTNPYILEL